MNTEKLALFGRDLILLYTEFRSSDSYESRGGNRVYPLYPETVLRAMYPDQSGKGYAPLCRKYKRDSGGVLKEFEAYLAGVMTKTKLPKKEKALHEMGGVLKMIYSELATRPLEERKVMWERALHFPEEVFINSLGSAFVSGLGFTIVDPKYLPAPSRKSILNQYFDSMLGIVGCRDHEKINRKYRNHDKGDHEFYTYVGYETISSSYADLRALYRRLDLKPGQKVVDIGSAYGRPGLYLGIFHPEIQYVGYELMPERVALAKQYADRNSFKNVTYREKDASKGIEDADVFYLYEPVSAKDMAGVIESLRDLNHQRNGGIKVIAKEATGVLDKVLRKQDWLVETDRIFSKYGTVYRIFEGLPRSKRGKVERSYFDRTMSVDFLRKMNDDQIVAYLNSYFHSSEKVTTKPRERIREVQAYFLERLEHAGTKDAWRMANAVWKFLEQYPVSTQELKLKVWRLFHQRRFRIEQVVRGNLPVEIYLEALRENGIVEFENISRKFPTGKRGRERIRDQLKATLLGDKKLQEELEEPDSYSSIERVIRVCYEWGLSPLDYGIKRTAYLGFIKQVRERYLPRTSGVYENPYTLLRFLEGFAKLPVIDDRQVKLRLRQFLDRAEVKRKVETSTAEGLKTNYETLRESWGL